MNHYSPIATKIYSYTTTGTYSFQNWQTLSCILVYDNTTDIFGLLHFKAIDGSFKFVAKIPKENLTTENYTSSFPGYFFIGQNCSMIKFKDQIYEIVNQSLYSIASPSGYTAKAMS